MNERKYPFPKSVLDKEALFWKYWFNKFPSANRNKEKHLKSEACKLAREAFFFGVWEATQLDFSEIRRKFVE